MFILKNYQERAKRTFEKYLSLFNYPAALEALKADPNNLEAQHEAQRGKGNTPFTIQIDAPTGSGKTVLMGNIIKDNFKNYVHFWFSPGAGDLEEQSARSLRNVLGASAVERMDESTFNFHPAQGITYIGNWEQFVSRDRLTGSYKNRVVREGDNKTFFDMIAKIGESYTPVAITIDEAHHGSKKNVGAIQSFLDDIETMLGYSPLYVQLSATHIVESAHVVKISQDDVVNEGLMRKEVLLNSKKLIALANDLDDEERNSEAIEPLMVSYAMDLLDEIDEEYEKVDAHEFVDGKKHTYTGLLGIQVPNGAPGAELMERMESLLRDRRDKDGNPDPVTRDNGRLAVYLSDDKTENMNGIESAASPVRVLMYKQGVSTGWDCPRAQVLLGFRHITSHVFTKQNLGRFVRTTQAKHYENELLDRTYVLSNVGDLGQASFNEKKDNTSGITVKEVAALRRMPAEAASPEGEGEAHVALSSFNEFAIPVSHYAKVNQLPVSLSELTGLFREKANESKLWETYEYTDPNVDYSGIITGTDDLIDGLTGFTHDEASKMVLKGADELSMDLQGVVSVFIKGMGRTFRNDAQVARSLVTTFVAWYKQAVTRPESYRPGREHFSRLAHLSEKIDHKNPSWDRISLEQTVYVDAHREALLDVVGQVVNDPRSRSAYIEDDEGLQHVVDRKFTEDGEFFISPLQEFFVHEEDNSVPASLEKYHALTGTLHQGTSLSGPESAFQTEFLPQLIEGGTNALVSFYKSPENRTGSFCLGVEVTDDKVTNFYPDWLLELRSKTDGKFVPAVVESKSGAEMADARSDSTHPTFAKAKRLAELAEETGIRAGIVYKDSAGAWNVTTGEKYGILTSTPAKEYFTL